MNGELVHQLKKDGFTIRLYLESEDHAPDCDFETPEDEADTLRQIDNGTLLWFRAHVVALKHGHELGHDYIGECCYKSVADFIKSGDYFDDMVNEAVIDARKTLKMLAS